MIWLVGYKGMLGQELVNLISDQYELLATDKEIDITDLQTVKSFVDDKQIDWIVNCAAYTAVDDAEDNPETAFKLNETGIFNLGAIASKLGVPVIHVSTDYVFNGKGERPYVEDDVVDPIGVYGKSKYAGEEKLKTVCEKFFIIRTSWLYGRFGKNFVNTMLTLMGSRESVKVVNDQYGSPTWAYDLANFILFLIGKNNNQYGVYHFSNDGALTWYEFAKMIYALGIEKKILNNKCTITPCTTKEFSTKAERPSYSVMSKEKVKTTLNYKVPVWRDSLELYLGQLLEKSNA